MRALLSQYLDLIWDFDYDSATQQVMLRVFHNEQEIFEARDPSPEPYPVVLPLDWSGRTGASRSEWSRSRLPAGMLAGTGRQLWEAIPPPAKSLLQEGTPDLPCRVKITSSSSVIDDLPWEWLNDGTGAPFALRPEFRIVRSIPVRLVIPAMSVTEPLRVLLVLTNPKDERLLDPGREINAILPALQAPSYFVSVLQEPTWEALTRALQEVGPHILHYIGHAGIQRGEGNLILHDWMNHTHWIGGPELSQALPVSVRLLCLSTCFTTSNYQILGLPRLAHTSSSYWLPTSLANSYPLAEDSVRTFWSVFYGSLAGHRGNANDAFHAAQNAVASQPGAEADWGSFSLVIRDQSGEVMRFEAGPTKSVDEYAREIQAQFASRIANDLAERLRSFSPEEGGVAQENLRDAATHATDLTESLS